MRVVFLRGKGKAAESIAMLPDRAIFGHGENIDVTVTRLSVALLDILTFSVTVFDSTVIFL